MRLPGWFKFFKLVTIVSMTINDIEIINNVVPKKSWAIYRKQTWKQIGKNLAYILPGYFISTLSFTLFVAMLSTGFGSIITLIGIPILFATLYVAKWVANFERFRLKKFLGEISPVFYKKFADNSLKNLFKRFLDLQFWRDLLCLTLINFPIRTATFFITIFFIPIIFSFLTAWLLILTIPEYISFGDKTLDQYSNSLLYSVSILLFILGLLFLFAFPFVTYFLAWVDSSTTKFLLTNEKTALKQQQEHLTTSRSQIIAAEINTLRRLERDLHDGPQQRLIRLQMDIETASRKLTQDPAGSQAALDEALTQAKETLSELRNLSKGIAPPILAEKGLIVAIESLVERCPIRITFSTNLPKEKRFLEKLENVVYFVVAECLTNIAKHSKALAAEITFWEEPTNWQITISDDGCGGAHLGKGHGLAGLVDRLAGVDGSLKIFENPNSSTKEVGTVISVNIPIV